MTLRHFSFFFYHLGRGIVYGCGHIGTFDKWRYTFNGLGEYTIATTTEDKFIMQGRTSMYTHPEKTDLSATLWSAFAFKEETSPRIQIGFVDPKNISKGNHSLEFFFCLQSLSLNL